MQGNHFAISWHVGGTLAADQTFRWVAPFAVSLVHAQAVASNDSDATIKMGTSADDDGYLTATTIGDSGTPAEYDLDDWDGALISNAGDDYPHVTDGTIILVTLDYDGSSGTAAQNVSITLTFSEG
jgi:hypothetical protein